MDSLTHLFYGGAIAAAIAPRAHRRAAILAGMALNTLPDLDALLLMPCADPVLRMTWHRSFSHSWLVLPFVAWAIWAFFRRRGGRVAQAPARWFWLILVTLLAHPLLDAFTVYGTQLFWPLPMRPIMWSSLFIIDPLFSLPWIAACAFAWCAPTSRVGQRGLATGITLGIAYLGWSLAAKTMVDVQADRALAAMGLRDAPRFSVPMPLNTLLWRVVAMTPGGYVEGFHSLLADSGPMRFESHASNLQALGEAQHIPAVRRLQWFARGFVGAQVVDDRLHLSDLRMGSAPTYFFVFDVAYRRDGAWRTVLPPLQLDAPRNAGAILNATWQRMWHMPPVPGSSTRLPGQPPTQAARDQPGSTSEIAASK